MGSKEASEKGYFTLRLKYNDLSIEFSKRDYKGIEKVKFDPVGNLEEIHSVYGKYRLSRKHVAHIYNDIPEEKTDDVVRLSYETAEMVKNTIATKPNKDADSFKKALEIICKLGYEGYKTRENLEGWSKFIPPLEEGHLVLYNEVMTGCPKSEKNPCIFCNVYRNEKFSVIPLDQFSRREQELSEYVPTALDNLRKSGMGTYGGMFSGKEDLIKKMLEPLMETTYNAPIFFWGSGNIFALKPKDLLKRLEKHNEYFRFNPSDLDMRKGIISAFGHSKYILNHKDLLKEYHALGLREVWVGVESGDDVSLKIMNKSATAKNHAKAGKALNDAGIRCSATVLYSTIDEKLQEAHIKETKKLVSEMRPACVYFSDLVIHEGTKLSDLIEKKEILLPKERKSGDMAFASVSGVMAWKYDIPV